MMSKPFITITITFTTLLFGYLYHLTIKQSQTKRIDLLISKINELESKVLSIQSSIDDLENTLHIKNNKIIESNIALNSKLDDFINYTYDICDE